MAGRKKREAKQPTVGRGDRTPPAWKRNGCRSAEEFEKHRRSVRRSVRSKPLDMAAARVGALRGLLQILSSPPTNVGALMLPEPDFDGDGLAVPREEWFARFLAGQFQIKEDVLWTATVSLDLSLNETIVALARLAMGATVEAEV